MIRFLSIPGILLCAAALGANAPRVKVGADVLLEKHADLLRGKRVGLVTNHTGRIASGEYLLDALVARGIRVTALFGPEHGIRGGAEAGETVADLRDPRTGLPVFSLYGPVRKPTPVMLENVDLLVYDIQDVGARFYTYISTMALCMEAAAEAGIPYVVLDRPNPLGGVVIDGPVLPDSLRSFVGYLPIPVVYGLTIGELAALANTEGWLGHRRADLTIIPMEGWTRTMRWNDTGLPWIPPSPNIRLPGTPLVYPATCYLEATNISEGRGTDTPFAIFGAPFVHSAAGIAARLNGAGHRWLRASDTAFVPISSKHRGRTCQGAVISIQPTDSARPVLAGLEILSILARHCGDSLQVNRVSLGRLLGDPEAIDLLQAGASVPVVARRWDRGREAFSGLSRRYWRYPER